MIRTLDNKNKQMIRVSEYEALKQKLTAAEFTAITDEIDKVFMSFTASLLMISFRQKISLIS